MFRIIHLLTGLSAIICFSSCATKAKSADTHSALLGDPRESAYLKNVANADTLHAAFIETYKLKQKHADDGEYRENAIVKLHTYLFLSGDQTFVKALEVEPLSIQKAVIDHLVLAKIQQNSPLTYKLASTL
jgi:hypothetical protein